MMKIAAAVVICFFAPSVALAQTQPAPTAAKSSTSDPNKLRCKSRPEIGSLVKKVRECHTVAEWQQIGQQGRTDAAAYQDAVAAGGGH